MTCPATYVVTQADVDAGTFSNTATADSAETGPDSDSETVPITQNPGLTLDKSITSGDPYDSVGDVIQYSYLVENTGSVTLDGPFVVYDDQSTDESCPSVASLAPGDWITCTASHTVVQGDLDAGALTNTAYARAQFGGSPVTSNTDQATATAAVVVVIDPAVTKGVDPITAQVGDTVTFTLQVFNNGEADAANVVVTDVIPAFLDILGVDAPGATTVSTVGNTLTITYLTVTPTDLFTVTITTEVNELGAPPGGTNEVTLISSTADSNPANNLDSVSIAIVTVPELGAPATGFAPDRQTSIPVQPASEAYRDYGSLSLEIPTIDLETEIVGIPLDDEGWDVTWLWDQAGYLAGTAFPTWDGNSVLTGHVVLPSGLEGPFARLRELGYGDRVIVHGWGMRYIYEVREVDIVRPNDASIFRHEERSWLTLLTCQGYDERSETYRWRRVVRAVLMRVAADDASVPGTGSRPWAE